MAESAITGHVWPEDSQTGTAVDNEDWSSAGYLGGILAKDNASQYVERGLGLSADYTNNIVDVAAGLAFLEYEGTVGVQEPTDDSSTFSGTWEQQVTFAIETKAEPGVGLTDGAINRVWLATDLTTNDGAFIRTDTETTPNVPAKPRLKLGEVDTTNNTTTEENRDPTASFASLTAVTATIEQDLQVLGDMLPTNRVVFPNDDTGRIIYDPDKNGQPFVIQREHAEAETAVYIESGQIGLAGEATPSAPVDIGDDVNFQGAIGVDLAQGESGAATDGQVPTADGAGAVNWEDVSGGSSTADIVDNLSVNNWSWTDVGNEGFPGDRSGGDLAQFIADNSETGYNAFILPEGTYEWQQTLQWDNSTGGLAIPDGLIIIGRPEATIHVTSGVQADLGRCFDLGDAYGTHNDQMHDCYIANLHFDVGTEDAARDAGIGRHQTGKNCLFENLSISRRYRRNDDGTTNGDRFTWRMDVGNKEATVVCRNFDFTAGERYNSNNDETVGHAIPISAENDHVGTAIYEGCKVAEYVDNGYYLKDGIGQNVVKGGYVRECGGGGFRLGRNDRLEDSKAEYNTAADYYGAALWIQEGQATSIDGLRIDVNTDINDCIRFTDLMGGCDLANIQIELANVGEFALRDSSTTVDDAMVTVRNMTVWDNCDGSVREAGIELRSSDFTFIGLNYYDQGGRVPISQRGLETGHTIFRDSYFEMNGVGVARAGSNLDAPIVDYVFDGCKFLNNGAATGLIWDSRPADTLERLVIKNSDCRQYDSLFYETGSALTDYNIGELRSNQGYGNQANNSYAGP